MEKVVARILFLLLLIVIPCSVEGEVTKKPAGTTPGVTDQPATPKKFSEYTIAGLCGALSLILLGFLMYCCYKFLKHHEEDQREMEEEEAEDENHEVDDDDDDVETPVLAPEEKTDEEPQ